MATFFEQQRQEKATQRAARSQEIAAEREARANKAPIETKAMLASDERAGAIKRFKDTLMNSPKSITPEFSDDIFSRVKEVTGNAIKTGTGIPSLFNNKIGLAAQNLPVSDNLNHHNYILQAIRETEARVESAKKGSFSATRYDRAHEALRSAQENLDLHFDSHLRGKGVAALKHLTAAAKHLDEAVKYGDAAGRHESADNKLKISNDEKASFPWGEGFSGPNVRLGEDEHGLTLSDRLGAVVDSYKGHLAEVAGNKPEVKFALRQSKFTPAEGDFTPPIKKHADNTPKESKDLGPKRLREDAWDISGLMAPKQALTSHLAGLRKGVDVAPGSGPGPISSAERAYVARVKDAAGAKLDNKELFKAPELAGLRYAAGGPSDTEIKRTKEVSNEDIIKDASTAPEEAPVATPRSAIADTAARTQERLGLGGHFDDAHDGARA